MSLLDDLREDLIADALSAPAAKRATNDWVEKVTWKFEGYLARVRAITCPSCKCETWHSLGVFAEEVGSNNTRRLTKATQFPIRETKRMEFSREDGELCPGCLEKLGFTDMVEAPSIPTNIAGEGMITTPGFRNSLGFVRTGAWDRDERSEGGKLTEPANRGKLAQALAGPGGGW